MINVYRSTTDLKKIDSLQIAEIANKVQTEGAAIFYDQDLTEGEYVDFIKKFGECESPGFFMNMEEYPEIFRVTDEKDQDGNKIGMFGGGELGWHSNGNNRPIIDKILVSLLCVQGDPNTTLSICQTSQPFYDMCVEEQEFWKTINIRLKFENNTMYNLDDDDPELEFMSTFNGSIRPLVNQHPITGQFYFYFPYHSIQKTWQGKKQVDHLEIIEKLKSRIFQSKYQYHHVFKDGDLLLMDQFTTLHRRTPVQGPRLLYRTASDYNNITNRGNK